MHKSYLNFYVAYSSEVLAEGQNTDEESNLSQLELAASHYDAAARDLPLPSSQKPVNLISKTSEISDPNLPPSKIPTLVSPSQKSSNETGTPPTEPDSQDHNLFGPSVRFVLPSDPSPQAHQTTSAPATAANSLSQAMARQRLNTHLTSLKPLLRNHATWINEELEEMRSDEGNGRTWGKKTRTCSRNRIKNVPRQRKAKLHPR